METLTLLFEEHGKEIGVVFYDSEGFAGNTACISVVRNRMKRNEVDAVEAMKSMDGWSNGYLKTRLAEPLGGAKES